jgi:phenylpropionate dioxygenase-like ring-hydroxylating dioxygenase large terminal subunit
MQSELLFDVWYVAAHGAAVKPGKTIKKKMLRQNLLIGRDKYGEVFALRDFCPHRGMPLSYGTFDGETIECCYHGWCFNTKGACTAIPSLTPDDDTNISRIKAKAFPCREVNGLIWVYVAQPGKHTADMLPEVPQAPVPLSYRHVETVLFPCHVDHAVIGLMDPSHGPFVHTSWWWRTRRSMHVKTKNFAPYKMGFKMVAHAPSSNSRAYKILGGKPVTEISFQLPSMRTEYIQVGKRSIILLTALLPIDEKNTELQQYIATDIAWANLVLPLVKHFGKAFIAQDLDVVKKQQEGLAGENLALLLLGDADKQALWYYKLKKDFLSAQTSGAAFENRVPEKTLSWRS